MRALPLSAWLLCCCSLAACAPARSPAITLEGGGDAWTLERAVSGRADPACRAVDVRAGARRLHAIRDGERFTAVVPLEPGRNEIAAICETGHIEVVSAPISIDARVAPDPRPRAEVALEGDTVVVREAAGGGWDLGWTPRPGNPAAIALAGGGLFTAARGRELRLTTPPVDGEYYLSVEARDAQGRTGASTAAFLVEGGRARVPEPGFRPRWVRDAVLYGVVPRLFGAQGLRSVTAELDDLADLGITTLWLAPVFSAPAGDYGYAWTDTFTVREELGGEPALRELVGAAHARGLRVILDFVPNHTSRQHPYFVDAEARGPASPYHAFYRWENGRTPEHYFDWTHLPNLDLDNPEVERWLTEAALHWVRDVGVDGYRVDAAWGPRTRSPAFLRRWAAELRRVRPDLLLLAEASALDGYWRSSGFDLAYDWTERPGEWRWQPAFEDRAGEGRDLRRALFDSSPPSDRVARFLDNNDTGMRFHDRYGLGIHDAAFTLLLTAPGVPALFTGEEVAASYEPYATSAPIARVDPHGVRARVRALLALRRRLPALRSPTALAVDTGSDPELLGYARLADRGGAPALVLLSFADAPRSLTPALPDAARALTSELRDARTGERFAPGAAIPLAAGQGRILVRAADGL